MGMCGLKFILILNIEINNLNQMEVFVEFIELISLVMKVTYKNGAQIFKNLLRDFCALKSQELIKI